MSRYALTNIYLQFVSISCYLSRSTPHCEFDINQKFHDWTQFSEVYDTTLSIKVRLFQFYVYILCERRMQHDDDSLH